MGDTDHIQKAGVAERSQCNVPAPYILLTNKATAAISLLTGALF